MCIGDDLDMTVLMDPGAEYECFGLTLGGVTVPPPMYLGLAVGRPPLPVDDLGEMEYFGEVVGVKRGFSLDEGELPLILGIWKVLVSLLPPSTFLTSSSRSLSLLSLL